MSQVLNLKKVVIKDLTDKIRNEGISQATLAECLGVSRQMVNVWLKGESVTLDKLLEIAEYLNIKYKLELNFERLQNNSYK